MTNTAEDLTIDQVACLSYWFPKLEAAGMPVPKTKIIHTDVELSLLLDGVHPTGCNRFLHTISAAVQEIGLPAFLRTGHGSGKHNWGRTCFIQDYSIAVLKEHVGALVEWSECVDMFGLPYNVWAVREMLPTRPLFRCRDYGGFPVVKEIRFFCRDGVPKYMQNYWPLHALEDGDPDVENWREIYQAAMKISPDEAFELTELVKRAMSPFPGDWSIDVLDTAKGWYITDMAPAAKSYGFDQDRMQ